MRQRLSSKFITFTKVTGEEIYPKFFVNGEIEIEAVIEDVYKNAFSKATNHAVEVVKRSAPRGITDGFITATITKQGKEVECFYGIQEVKRKIKRNTAAYYKQIGQGLLYAVQFQEDIKVVLFPSENYIDYLYLDENNIDKNELLNLLKNDSPCKACKNVNTCNLKIHQIDMPTQAKIDEMWKNIYKHCIDL